MIKISIDVMGAELGPKIVLNGAFNFLKDYKDVFFYFVGDKNLIEKDLFKLKFPKKNYKIIHTTEILTPNDNIISVRRKKNSSLVKSIELVNDNVVDAVISGGPTALFFVACHLIIKEIKGIERPAFLSFIPNIKNGVTLLLDVGANLECKPIDLYRFAHMAKVYAKEIFNIKNPKIGLINIGEEKHKGKELHKKTYELLEKDKGINFYGNIEPKLLFSGQCDILVTDGYTGNIALKTLEGTASTILNVIKSEYRKNFFSKLKALISLKVLKNIKNKFNYKKYNGALVIGLNKIVFKTHGSSDDVSYYSVIEMTYKNIKKDIIKKINYEIENEMEKGNDIN